MNLLRLRVKPFELSLSSCGGKKNSRRGNSGKRSPVVSRINLPLGDITIAARSKRKFYGNLMPPNICPKAAALCAVALLSATPLFGQSFSDPIGLGNLMDDPLPGFITPQGNPATLPFILLGDEPEVINTFNEINPAFVGWASRVIEARLQGQVPADFSDPAAILGPVSGNPIDVVSLGRFGDVPGSITVGFDRPIVDGPGPDFVVFENGARQSGFQFLLEAMFVEVSSDGENFFRFPSIMEPLSVGEDGNRIYDSRRYFNLAGKHENNQGQVWGTPFDLSDLAEFDGRGLDLRAVTQVRLVDVIGDGSALDSLGNPIFDADPDAVDEGGEPVFDLNFGGDGADPAAVGVLHSAAENFDAYQEEYFSGADDGPGDDPDTDGENNFREYLGNEDPTVPTVFLPNFPAFDVKDATMFRWAWRGRKADVRYQILGGPSPAALEPIFKATPGAPFQATDAAPPGASVQETQEALVLILPDPARYLTRLKMSLETAD